MSNSNFKTKAALSLFTLALFITGSLNKSDIPQGIVANAFVGSQKLYSKDLSDMKVDSHPFLKPNLYQFDNGRMMLFFGNSADENDLKHIEAYNSTTKALVLNTWLENLFVTNPINIDNNTFLPEKTAKNNYDAGYSRIGGTKVATVWTHNQSTAVKGKYGLYATFCDLTQEKIETTCGKPQVVLENS